MSLTSIKYQFPSDRQPMRSGGEEGPGGRLAILRFPCPQRAVSNRHARRHPKAAYEYERDTGECTEDVSKVFRPRSTIT